MVNDQKRKSNLPFLIYRQLIFACMRRFILLILFIYLNNHFYAQNDFDLLKRAKSLTAKLSVDQKIAQTCQVTLDALLKTDANGQVKKPIELDPKKCEKLI